jgi:predicted nucleic acid-binding protein
MAEVPRVYSTGKKQSTVFSYYEGRAGYRGPYNEYEEHSTKSDKPTGEMDALIAATAMAHKAVIVTGNRKH